ncbi:MAG: OsmC-like protein [Acidobacteriaceae bacterium]|nr:OsmC-like protein [Acidobacteriaceae bacterium]
MLKATAKWTGQMQFEGTGNAGHTVLMDGESKAGDSPMDLVLIALCGCTASDVVSILQKKRELPTAVEVSAHAEKAPEPPRVYTEIKLVYRVSGKVTRKAVEDAVRLSEEKYCSVAAMLNKTARITYEIHLDNDDKDKE